MTVGELINKLSQYPKDTLVSVFGEDDFGGILGGSHVRIAVNPAGVVCIVGTYPSEGLVYVSW